MKSKVFKILIAIVSVGVLFGIGWQVFTAFYDPYESITVKQGTYEKKVELSGYFVRDEKAITVEQPGADGTNFLEQLNPDSIRIVKALVEPKLAELPAGTSVQFERNGYYCVDPDSKPGAPVFNRTVTLKDSWGNKQGK